MSLNIQLADYNNPQHGEHIIYLLNCYALDAMGGGQPLSSQVQKNLVGELSKLPHAFSLLAFWDGEPVGLINCFEAFSTFKAKPLINIHDVAVLPQFRGRGISQKLLKKVEQIAVDKGCCKLTLEVLSENEVARNAYSKFGFEGYELDPEKGQAEFWQKVF